MHELDSGRYFSAYDLYISAGLYNAAHTLALYELAPDAIIRKDLELLRTLFSRFDTEGRREKIDGWFVKGKVRIFICCILAPSSRQTFLDFLGLC